MAQTSQNNPAMIIGSRFLDVEGNIRTIGDDGPNQRTLHLQLQLLGFRRLLQSTPVNGGVKVCHWGGAKVGQFV
jgi:hypothetical protein